MAFLRSVAGDTWRRGTTLWVRLFGLLILCGGLSTFAAAAHTLEVTAAARVAENWRGTYDILVRHPEAVYNTIERLRPAALEQGGALVYTLIKQTP